VVRSGRYGYEALSQAFDNAVGPLLKTARIVEVRPIANISPVAADGSPERLVLERGADTAVNVVSALRRGAPSRGLLAYNSQFIVPAAKSRRLRLRRFVRVASGVYEARMPARLVDHCQIDGAPAELQLLAGSKETAVARAGNGPTRLQRPALADRVRLLVPHSENGERSLELEVRPVAEQLTLIVPEPWPTRTLKAAWRLLPLEWRLSAPAMRAKAAARALAQARRPSQVEFAEILQRRRR
jgi:hypothetical protein